MAENRMMTRKQESGFTLIELMVVVAVVSALAVVAVPSWLRESRKTKAGSEINAMFAELVTKEEQYKVNTDTYITATTCPTTVPTADYNFASVCATSGSAWQNLRVQPPSSNMRCQYTITTGAAGSTLTPPTGFTVAGQSWITPASMWWYIVATCDEDARGGTNASFFTSSVDTRIQ